MCGSMVDIQSPAAEIRRGNKKDRKKERKIVTTGQKYNGPLFHRAAIIRNAIAPEKSTQQSDAWGNYDHLDTDTKLESPQSRSRTDNSGNIFPLVTLNYDL